MLRGFHAKRFSCNGWPYTHLPGGHTGTEPRNRLAKNAGLAILVAVLEANRKARTPFTVCVRDALRRVTEVADMDSIKQ
jgi:hypothetical protein